MGRPPFHFGSVCPHCEKRFLAPNGNIGKAGTCPECMSLIEVTLPDLCDEDCFRELSIEECQAGIVAAGWHGEVADAQQPMFSKRCVRISKTGKDNYEVDSTTELAA